VSLHIMASFVSIFCKCFGRLPNLFFPTRRISSARPPVFPGRRHPSFEEWSLLSRSVWLCRRYFFFEVLLIVGAILMGLAKGMPPVFLHTALFLIGCRLALGPIIPKTFQTNFCCSSWSPHGFSVVPLENLYFDDCEIVPTTPSFLGPFTLFPLCLLGFHSPQDPSHIFSFYFRVSLLS